MEYIVRGFILEIPEERIDGLLATTENGPSIRLSLLLREVLGTITVAQGIAI